MAGFGFFVVGAIVVVVLAEGVVVVVVDVAATAPVVTNPTPLETRAIPTQ